MSQSGKAVDRARVDLAEGRPWKARERLRAYLKAHPLDAPARDLLGETLSTMRDLPAAGAVWFLSERDDDATRAAIDALRREHGRAPASFRAALDVRAPVEAWPEPVQARLRDLQAEAARSGARWEPYAPRRAAAIVARDEDEVGGRVAAAGCLLVLLVLAACLVLGAVELVDLLV